MYIFNWLISKLSNLQIIYPFIEIRNSVLSFVPFMFFNKVFSASSGFISAICVRTINMRPNVCLSSSKSSRRV